VKHKPNWTRAGAIDDCITQLILLKDDLAGEFTVAHLEAAESWPDRFECLRWAVEARATVAEMTAWHRAQNGLDLFSGDVK
jgi:hypothetical protein